MRSRRLPPDSRRTCTCCCSSAASCSSACASSSSPPSPGWPSCSRIRSSASRCSAIRRRFRRSAACWSPVANGIADRLRGEFPGYLHAGLPGLAGHDRSDPPTRGVALYAHVGPDSRDSADFHPPVPARVAGLGKKDGGRHAQAAHHCCACFRPRSPARRSSPRSASPARWALRSAPFSRCRRSCRASPKCRPRSRNKARKPLPPPRRRAKSMRRSWQQSPARRAGGTARRWPPNTPRCRNSADSSGARPWRSSWPAHWPGAGSCGRFRFPA